MTAAHVIFVTDDRTTKRPALREFSDLPPGLGIARASIDTEGKYDAATDDVKETVTLSSFVVQRLECTGSHVVCSVKGRMFDGDTMFSLSPGERAYVGRYQSAPNVYVSVYVVAEEE